MTTSRPIRLLILGTGGMANSHAAGFGAIPGVELVAAVDVSADRLGAFLEKHRIGRGFESLGAALEWGAFDAVANVTPDSVHHATTLEALAAGKHVFCEKPLATDYPRALEMAEAAEGAGRVAMVNLTYRNVAELHTARNLVLAGALGEIKHVEASYLQSWLVSNAWGDWRSDPKWLWRLSTAHGSNGALGDIGIHILDFAGYGAASNVTRVFGRLKAFHKADGDRIDEYVLDANDSFTLSAEFGNGALGVIHATRWAPGHINELRLRLYGDKGGVEVKHSKEGSSVRACLGEDVHSATWRTLRAEPVPTNYQRFIAAVRAGATREPSFRHAAGLQRVLDASMLTESERCERAVDDALVD